MSISAVLSYAAAYLSVIVAAAVLVRDRRSAVHRMFAAGLLLFAIEEGLRGFSYGVILPAEVVHWHRRIVLVSSLTPSLWLGFSLTYARVNARATLSKWKWVLLASGLLPMAFIAIFRKSLFQGQIHLEDEARWSIPLTWQGQTLKVFFLIAAILILFNLERTLRSSMGRMRWQIKFMALGVGELFALRIYLVSQNLLYARVDTGLGAVNAIALLAANLLFILSLVRGRSLNVDVYLSTATIQNSLTIVLTGVYLLSVGVLANLAKYSSLNRSLPLDAFFVFISLTVLATLLLSNRLRRNVRLFVSRNFHRPVYDYRNVWMDLTHRTTSLMDAHELSTAVSRMVSESLEILSVSVWLVDESHQRLALGGSTAISGQQARQIEKAGKGAPELIRFLQERPACLDFQQHDFSWPRQIMEAGKELFGEHRIRYAIGLAAGGEFVGVMTLNDDRVGRENDLSEEDLVLLETLAAQLAAGLLNLRLSAGLRHAKEVETFQTVSTFFVHDLKNLASRLSLTMQNLPANFENPEFRADALRVISSSVTKIGEMCARLSMLKQNIELKPEACDLNAFVTSTLSEFKGSLKAELTQDLRPVPKVMMDREQIHKVLTNLVINASEAVNGDGVIHVTTTHEGRSVGFSVRDNGCGMTEEFIEKSLFRPFQTTKKKGLGIGLFHSKLIVEAHRGTFEVTSSPATGTEFRVLLPYSQEHLEVDLGQKSPQLPAEYTDA